MPKKENTTDLFCKDLLFTDSTVCPTTRVSVVISPELRCIRTAFGKASRDVEVRYSNCAPEEPEVLRAKNLSAANLADVVKVAVVAARSFMVKSPLIRIFLPTCVALKQPQGLQLNQQ